MLFGITYFGIGRDNISEESIVDDAETLAQLRQRQVSILRELIASVPQEREDVVPRVLVISHGRFIRELINHFCLPSALLRAPQEIIQGGKVASIANCSLSVLRVHAEPPPPGPHEANTLPADDLAFIDPGVHVEALLVNWTAHIHSNEHSLSEECAWLLRSS